jgi:post-segregation antitoxin (ccd killing protein)
MPTATKKPAQRRRPEPNRAARRTITIPLELDRMLSAVSEKGEFSAFAQRAFLHELQRERIAEWLEERLSARGGKPLSKEAREFAERMWRARKT